MSKNDDETPEIEQRIEQIAHLKQAGVGLTSEQAGALIVSGGKTKDVAEAELIAAGQTLDMDALERAGVRRMMGFDFELQVMPNVLLVTTKERPYLRTRAKVLPGETDEYGNIISEDLIARLVDACVRLKEKYEEARAA